jgi:UDP-glucuronate decarboxylase
MSIMKHTVQNRIVREDLEAITDAPLPWSCFDGKTVLITGANGFIPAYMVETLLYLAKKGLPHPAKVIGLVRDAEKARRRFAGYEDDKTLQIIVQDVCAPLSISEPTHYIVHAASQASPKYFAVDPVGTLSANVLGTHNLLTMGRNNGLEGFLFLSSSEVYGLLPEPATPIKEDSHGYLDPMDIRSSYAESKRMGETMCVSWARQYQVPTKVVRPFHTYGPGMRLDDGRVFADFVADIVNNRDIVVRSEGRDFRTFCYLADAVLGFLWVLLRGETGQAYNIGNDRAEIRISDLAELLASLFPEKRLTAILRPRSQSSDYLRSRVSRSLPDISKARHLGWEPKTSIADGFSKTVRSFE